MGLPRLQVRTHLVGRRHPAQRRWSVLDIRRANETAAVLRGYMADPKIAQTIFSNGYQDGFLVCSELLSKPAERAPGACGSPDPGREM